jgi:hypothetical protein
MKALEEKSFDVLKYILSKNNPVPASQSNVNKAFCIFCSGGKYEWAVWMLSDNLSVSPDFLGITTAITLIPKCRNRLDLFKLILTNHNAQQISRNTFLKTFKICADHGGLDMMQWMLSSNIVYLTQRTVNIVFGRAAQKSDTTIMAWLLSDKVLIHPDQKGITATMKKVITKNQLTSLTWLCDNAASTNYRPTDESIFSAYKEIKKFKAFTFSRQLMLDYLYSKLSQDMLLQLQQAVATENPDLIFTADNELLSDEDTASDLKRNQTEEDDEDKQKTKRIKFK